MRNMSFALTTEQARDRTKTVTRRCGWWNLKPGDLVQQVVKSQGLKKGEHVEKIHVIRIKSTYGEPLRMLTDNIEYGWSETTLEGFPSSHKLHNPWNFVDFFCESHHCPPEEVVNRIEFEYVD